MKPKKNPPPRPLPLFRRAFTTTLSPAEVADCLTPKVFPSDSLRAALIYLPTDRTVIVTGPGLYGDIHFQFRPKLESSGQLTAWEVIVDARLADKTAVAELIGSFGPAFREKLAPIPTRSLLGHRVRGHQPNVGHFLVWAACMPDMEDHLILESAIDAGLACEFNGFEHIHAVTQVLDYSRMARRSEGLDFAAGEEFLPPHRERMRDKLTGREAVRVLHRGRKLALTSTMDTREDENGRSLRVHYAWSPTLRRFLIGWVSERSSEG